MNTRLKKLDSYTISDLNGISKKCDWFINGNQLLKLNTGEPKTIFLTAYRGNAGIKYLVNNLLSQIKSPFILIIASEDYTFPAGKGDVRYNIYKDCQNLIKDLCDFQFLKHIFVENLDTMHHKMTPIPLGLLTPNMYINNYNFIDIQKTDLCIVCNRQRDGPQWEDRKNGNYLAKTEWKEFMKCIDANLSYTKFIQEIKNSKFCLIIHGGGYDPCPKFFECILFKTIPIIQHSPLDNIFNKFPAVFIDDLNKDVLSKDFLLMKYEELKEFYEEGEKRNEILKLLTLEYWWDIINNKFKKI